MEPTFSRPAQDEAQHARPPYASPSGSSDGSPPDFAHDDALAGPRTPGAALVRLLQVEAALPDVWSADREAAREARKYLERAVAEPNELQAAMDGAHKYLRALFENAMADADAEVLCARLGFPSPSIKAEEVAPVDLSTIIVTHSRPARQVLSTIAFADAANASGYRLFELKMLPGDEEYEDSTVGSLLPIFPRVRLAAGEHTFRIESRNAHARVLSEYFTISVPKP